MTQTRTEPDRSNAERRLTAAVAAEFTDAEWEIVDRIGELLDADPVVWWTPSCIARKAKTDTNTAWSVLRYLAAHRYCTRTDRGALSKFAGRP
jgi:hypothetical protein